MDITSVANIPKFHKGETVYFLGGHGKVQDYKSEAGTWTYWIEMTMGIEPEFGRVGNETVIVLSEADLNIL